MSDETKALAAMIEPQAVEARPDWDGQIALSQAISLKRIADALAGDNFTLFDRPINAYGETIGEAIQGQIERGQRGIANSL